MNSALRLLDDVLFQRRDRRQYLVLFLGRHVELDERGDQQLDRDVPVLFGDAEACVRGLHVAAGVDAWATGCEAELVDDVLTDPLDRVAAVTGEEAGEGS